MAALDAGMIPPDQAPETSTERPVHAAFAAGMATFAINLPSIRPFNSFLALARQTIAHWKNTRLNHDHPTPALLSQGKTTLRLEDRPAALPAAGRRRHARPDRRRLHTQGQDEAARRGADFRADQFRRLRGDDGPCARLRRSCRGHAAACCAPSD